MTRALVFAVALATLTPSVARADDVLEKARLLAARGRAFHDGGDYPAAIAAYNEAYALAPRAGLLFNLGQAYRLAGNCEEAVLMYRRYLESEPDDDHRAIARHQLEIVEQCHHRELAGIAPVPAARPPPVPPASEVSPAPQILDLDGPRREQQVGVWLALGGGAALAVAALFAFDAHEASDTVDNAYHSGKPTPGLGATADHGQHSADIATAFGVTGGLAIASGAVLYAIGRHHETTRRAIVMPISNGAEVRVTWQF